MVIQAHQKGWDGRALKRTPFRILILFPLCSTSLLAPHIKKFETYFAMVYLWTFAQCTEMHFASFLSGGIITAKEVNPPAKRTSVQCVIYQGI